MITDCQAIALSGGGGKGAYQIGVMKALSEAGILERVLAFSGTSVGALNAVLFSIGDPELAESVWLKFVSPETMLKNIEPRFGSLLSRDSLKAILEYVGVARIRDCRAVFATLLNLTTHKAEYHRLNDKTDEQIINLLLASSALPIAYPSVEIDGNQYIDGGIWTALGNHPVEPLIGEGYQKIILVALSSEFDPYDLRSWDGRERVDLTRKFPSVDITVLKPTLYNGKGLDGMLDFRPKNIRERIACGYDDCANWIKGVNKGLMSTDERIRIEAEACIKSKSDFENFVRLFPLESINAKTDTMGGKVWYTNVFEVDGWRIQQHSVLPNHYRILDEKGVRRAWTLDPRELEKKLMRYKADKKSKRPIC